MFHRLCVIVPIIVASTLLAADLPEKWSKRLETADAAYQSAVSKADNTRFYAVQKAAQERVKILKGVLTEATKAGDFDTATEIKSRLAAAESSGVRAKPKNAVKFGGHEYALIEEKATWHVAKRLCEEMGGHLATVESPAEQAFLQQLCDKDGAWLGASDESSEAKWQWVTGAMVNPALVATWSIDNEAGMEHHLFFYPKTTAFMDGGAGTRFAFVCEFDN